MTKANEKVLAMVRQELENDPHVSNKTLFTKAKRINRSVGRMNPRRFHAMYRLQAARTLTPAKARKPRAKPAGTKQTPVPNRDAVRAVLLELATAVAAADHAGVVGVIGSIDRYVDRVVAA